MIAALLLGLVVAGQGAPPAAEDEIVVIGQRLKNLRIVMKRDRRTGGRRCFLKPSSGDAVFDAGVCATYVTCAATATTAPELEACMRPPLTTLAAGWVTRRKALATTMPR